MLQLYSQQSCLLRLHSYIIPPTLWQPPPHLLNIPVQAQSSFLCQCYFVLHASPQSPHVHQEPVGLLQKVLPEVTELCNRGPIHHPVVSTPADIHNVPLYQLVGVGVVAGEGLDTPQGNNGGLWGVEHGRGSRAANSACSGQSTRQCACLRILCHLHCCFSVLLCVTLMTTVTASLVGCSAC